LKRKLFEFEVKLSSKTYELYQEQDKYLETSHKVYQKRAENDELRRECNHILACPETEKIRNGFAMQLINSLQETNQELRKLLNDISSATS
jgi:uncharacterized coiled-coil DUF342 family protein